MSIVAQILLSLKRIENWPVWIAINAISVFVYGSQQLWLYTALYAFFFFNGAVAIIDAHLAVGAWLRACPCVAPRAASYWSIASSSPT